MKHDNAPRFTLQAGAAALAAGTILLPVVAGRTGAAWAIGGWLVASLAGVASGALLAARHGRPGPGFLGAFGGGIALRFALYAAIGVPAALAGRAQLIDCLIGLGVGYAAVQAFEIVWFFRRSQAV